MLRWVLISTVVGAGFVFACSSDGSSGFGPTDGGVDAGGSGGSSGSSGSSGTGGSGGTAGAGADASTSCQNSLDCTPPQVCDTVASRCVDCVGNNDCDNGKACRNQKCVTVVPCQSDNNCTPLGLLCDPVTQTCVECVKQSDCDAGYFCSQGSCVTQVCGAGQTSCENNAVVTCKADGSGYESPSACTGGKLCIVSGTSAQCKDAICQPNQPACNGSVATRCDATGNGYQSGGTDCATSGKTCTNGVCQSCPAAPGAVDQVRINEFFLGSNDYVVLENVSAGCSADLAGMTLDFRSSDPGANIVVTLPAFQLKPKSKVFVVEPGDAMTGDIDGMQELPFVSDSMSINVLLCKGSCINLQSIVDVLSTNGGPQPPALPPGVSFSPQPVSGITQPNEETQAYKRTAYAGATPNFRQSDYAVAPASRPFMNSPDCPATQPSGACTAMQMNLTCSYPPSLCFCALNMWICQ